MWLEVDEDLPEHPKSNRLCTMLTNPLGWAYVIKLWRWCVKFAPTGDLTNFGAEELEYGLGWTLDAGKLYAALKTAGFIENTEDGRVVVHDWMEHQGKALKKMETDRKRQAKFRRGRKRDVTCESPLRSKNIRVTAPVPNQTKPNLTQPNQTEKQPSPRPADRSSGTPIAELTFPCDGDSKLWSVTREQLTEWQGLYQHLDVMAECRKALAWIKANAEKQKTAGGMPKYLVKWLNRAQDKGGSGMPFARGATALGSASIAAAKNYSEGQDLFTGKVAAQ